MGEGAKRYYPAFLDLDGRMVVVVGSGRAAERKALQFVRAGADVTVITKSPSDTLVAAEGDGKLLIEERDYVRGDLAGAALVVCISDEPEIRIAVAHEARSVGCPVNISDAPELSTFLVPGVVHREPLQIAVATGGLVPELSKRVRRRIGELFDDDWKRYAQLVAEVRALGASRLEDPAAVTALMEALLDSDVLKRLRHGDAPSTEDLLAEFAPAPASDEAEPAVADASAPPEEPAQ